MNKRLINILFWSVISAAFIGPGTITTAAAAGADFGYSLIWALTFSTIACIVLQETSARMTLTSGINLGEALQQKLSDTPTKSGILGMIVGAVILGCAAYEAGNILGAVAGVSLVFNIEAYWIVLGVGIVAFPLFWFGTVQTVAKVMGMLVGLMGICFFITAILMQPDLGEIVRYAAVPHIPQGSYILILALVGTTVVPYNLFLGSGIASGQDVKEMRWSLSIAIGLGGIISIAVLVVGTAITGGFSFEGLAEALSSQLGGWAFWLLGIGLFAAGLSSAITAPLAAAITAKSVFPEQNKEGGLWADDGRNFRIVWIGVLLIGLIFGVVEVQPVPIIILAQALNGIVLPSVAIALLILANSKEYMGAAINTTKGNIFTSIVVFITIVIGIRNIARALTNALPLELVNQNYILAASVVVSAILSWPIYKAIQRMRNTGY